METGNLTRQVNDALVWAPYPGGMLQLWERPLVGCRYLLSVRGGAAWKLVGGRRDRERSVILVLRKGYAEEARTGPGGREIWHPTRLVARLRPPQVLDPTPLAEQTANVAEWYGDALCFVEVKDGPIVAKEIQRLGAAVQVREVLDKTNDEWTKEIGWLTDDDSGPAALNALVNAIRESARPESRLGLRVECAHCQAELETFAAADSAAAAVRHDDDVRALATGVFNIEAATKIHADTRARRPPQDGWQLVESFQS